MTAPETSVADVAAGLTEKARAFLLGVKIEDWWRTDEGERVPGTLLSGGMIEMDKPRGIDFRLYRITARGKRVRAHLKQQEQQS